MLFAQVLRRERFGVDDMDRHYADNIVKNKKFRPATEDDVADFDEGIDMYERRRGRLTQEEAQRREKSRQVRFGRRMDPEHD